MHPSYFQVFDEPSEQLRQSCEELGYACILMARSGSHSHRPFSHLNEIVIPAIAHRNIKFYFNDDGDLVGYVVWAFLAGDVEPDSLAGAARASSKRME